MQAITIAIGKTGIDFFVQQLLADHIIQLLGNMAPPDRTIPFDFVIKFDFNPAKTGWLEAQNIVVALTEGKLLNFTPVLESITQQAGGVFALGIESTRGFSAQYQWDESYDEQEVYYGSHTDDGQKHNSFTYTPAFSQLNMTIPLVFSFDTTKNAWVLSTGKVSSDPDVTQPNIPSKSILQYQSAGDCYGTQVSAATAQAVGAIDFASVIDALLQNVFASIPGSGDLGDGIFYNFSLGDSGLLFPGNDGIQMGVAGGASYNKTPFSGDTPPSLPLPAPLADGSAYHLNMYVSNYEIDALTWAFTQAGKLNMVLNPTDVPDPDVLKVKTYVGYAQALKPYQYFAMQARVTQNSAPVTAFQLVYQFTQTVINTLQNQLPSSVWNLLNNNIAGNNYASQTDLEDNLQGIGIEATYFPTIEAAAKTMGMVVHHNINYTLVIQTSESPQPTIVFNVTRVDILSNLLLGINTNQAQTMQFGFSNVTWNCTFVSSSIPGFDGSALDSVWGQAGESGYATIMANLGKTGVPVPIMQGFQFDFDQAVLSLQEGYVSILANVLYKK